MWTSIAQCHKSRPGVGAQGRHTKVSGSPRVQNCTPEGPHSHEGTILNPRAAWHFCVSPRAPSRADFCVPYTLYGPGYLAWGPSWKTLACARGLRNAPKGTKFPEGAFPSPRAQANIFQLGPKGLIPRARVIAPLTLVHIFTVPIVVVIFGPVKNLVMPKIQISPTSIQIESYEL